MKKGGKSKRFPDLNKDGKITMADILQGRGVKRQAYGGKVEMGMGGKTEYGIGGAILGGLNALKAGKGLGGAAMAAGKGFITPGSGIAQGAKMAGGLLAGSKNPALAKLGGLAGAASSFLPGGGGPMAALGALPGLFGGQSAEYGMKVKKMEHGGISPFGAASRGAAAGNADRGATTNDLLAMLTGASSRGAAAGADRNSDSPRADFLLRGDSVDDMNDLQQSRSDRNSAFGTASTDVFMNTGNIPSMPDREEAEDMRPPEDMQEIESRGPRLLRKDMDQGLMVGDQAPQQDQEFDMEFVFDQTPLPKGERDVRYQRYQKTMGVKDPKTGKYYFLDSARGFKGPKGPRNLSISSLPEDQRARVMKAIEDQEMKFAGESDFYRRQRGL